MRAAWWWIDRWRQSAAYRDFTPEQKGMYRDLLDEVWLRPGNVIPDDDRILGLLVGDPERWRVLRDSILAKFTRVEGGWTHSTAMEVIEQSKRRAENQKRYRERGDNKRDNARGNGADNKPDSPSPSPSPSLSLENVSTEPPPTYPLPPDVKTETALRNERWRDERSLLAVVGQIAEKTGKEAGEVMEHVTAYKRRDGSRAGGRRNPAQLRSHEAVVKSLDDAKAWLASLEVTS